MGKVFGEIVYSEAWANLISYENSGEMVLDLNKDGINDFVLKMFAVQTMDEPSSRMVTTFQVQGVNGGTLIIYNNHVKPLDKGESIGDELLNGEWATFGKISSIEYSLNRNTGEYETSGWSGPWVDVDRNRFIGIAFESNEPVKIFV